MNARQTLCAKKLRRNKAIMERYELLKTHVTCREAIEMLKDEYDLGKSTIQKILFIKDYSNSPLKEAS